MEHEYTKALFGCAGPNQDRSSGKRSDLVVASLATFASDKYIKKFTLEPDEEILLVLLILLNFKPSTLYLQPS